MRLVKRHIDKDLSGFIVLRAERDEDIWHAYNLIQEGDRVRAGAVRRIQSESSTGSVESHRIKLNLTIKVQKIAFSAAASSSSLSATANAGTVENGLTSTTNDAPATVACGPGSSGGEGTTLHLSGPVDAESQHVKMGSFHTLDLEPGRDFTIIKEPGEWDSIALERVQDACQEGTSAEVGAVICNNGQANVCLITQHTTIVRQRIEVAVPRKRKGGGTALGQEKATQRYHMQIYQAIQRHFDLDQLKAIIIASPGFTKEGVLDFIFAEAARTSNKPLLVARSKFLLVHSSSHHVHALTQVLSSPEIATQLKDTKFAREGLALDKFFRMLSTDELRAWYGESHVLKAAERGAIGTLLISDNLFKSSDFKRRRRFVQLVEEVKRYGGEVFIFSSMHESGEQLNQLTGVAAILTYPLDIEVVEEEERQEEEARQAAAAAEEPVLEANPNHA
ncbi:uncharacterized protein L969DRAFT_89848 [Mixia osmundae IAM 14324]|uniref:Protein DOM34 homolog n=1 Tax=Mixia osmundae (strain CBS 9802 / IAM 14324 / JCM 22182 / KY 12970) TaxID=764103 RepID=G7DWD2_MIXOS|nr:uncharacterized protein L969DRAFT_89848 [Mixia osmundae IAM 14324]KEI37296.1 hypothetical protein L969DRAFT_89848 [Mixia osmundae IAM 14324]GAA94892.1 hypothetical protein E5Q_01547 [Mixia osmundae IAM 14324]